MSCGYHLLRFSADAFGAFARRDLSMNSLVTADLCQFRRAISRHYLINRVESQSVISRNIAVSNIRALSASATSFSSKPKYYLKGNVKKLREQLSDQTRQFRDNLLTVPNGLCMLRIALTPVIGYLVVEEYFTVGLYLLSIAGITDLLDGLIARHVKGQSSLLGSVLDPVADKLLVSTLFITLTYVNLIPLLLTIIVISRDICLITGGFVKRYRLLVPPITLKRYFDPSVSPVKVAPTMVSKVNTALQLSLVACSLASPVFGFVGHPYLTALCFATGATTVFSGMQYAAMDRMKRV